VTGPYQASHAVGSVVQIAERKVLDDFARTWRLHNPLTPDQLAFAGRDFTIKSVGYYHGGDPLYVLNGAPGVWHEQCLQPAETQNYTGRVCSQAAYGAPPCAPRYGREHDSHTRYLAVRGTLTPEGHHGHLGAYSRELTAQEFLECRELLPNEKPHF
jgi:hypothetical protein